jgi:hypothetical protein
MNYFIQVLWLLTWPIVVILGFILAKYILKKTGLFESNKNNVKSI